MTGRSGPRHATTRRNALPCLKPRRIDDPLRVTSRPADGSRLGPVRFTFAARKLGPIVDLFFALFALSSIGPFRSLHGSLHDPLPALPGPLHRLPGHDPSRPAPGPLPALPGPLLGPVRFTITTRSRLPSRPVPDLPPGCAWLQSFRPGKGTITTRSRLPASAPYARGSIWAAKSAAFEPCATIISAMHKTRFVTR